MKFNSAHVTLNIAGNPMELTVTVPNKPVKQDVVLPLLRALDQKSEDIVMAKQHAKGERISCSKGCGVCCNQLVPLTIVEARYLTAFVERLPKKTRQKVLHRFEEAYHKIQAAGLMNALMNTQSIEEDIIKFGLDYFHLGIPCPFLEDDSCSIYSERPLKCREYLVTNPPEYCANPSKETIRLLDLPVHTSKTLDRISRPWSKYQGQWVPLSLLIAWVKQHPEKPVLRHSTEWIDDVLRALT